METGRRLFTTRAGLVAFVLLMVLFSTNGFTQSDTSSDNVTADSSTAPSSSAGSGGSNVGGNVNAEILKELDQMRARIQQLEAQLKAQSSTNAAASRNGEEAKQPATVPQEVATGLAAEAAVPQASKGQTAPPEKKAEPFAFADFTWLTGQARTKKPAFDSEFFTPEIRADVSYHYDFNHPKDDTISGSSEVFRANEFQLTHLGVGGDFHYDNVRARFLTQLGMYSQTQPRNDASIARGQWTLDGAYRYLTEAYGGYHFNKMNGINVDAGIFLSYIGLFSFYNFDNWTYQPSYVSSNTPWYFSGLRVQIFPTDKLKIEPWLINGWQSYGRFNHRPGVGGQILWRPNGSVSIVANQYAVGRDTLGVPNRTRYHTDDSIQVKYYDKPENYLDKMAFSFTFDAGCESGGGVSCFGNGKDGPKQSFLGYMIYNRFWFHRDLFGFTLGGGQINNPGRYLVLLPPINGATAVSGSAPFFTANPGDPFKAWDASATFDYMPSQYITFRYEYNHRAANVPYFSGSGGVTPPGGNTGAPGSVVPGFTPDLRKRENRMTGAIMVKF
jgi:Putative beta-barrel porin-2, OmpL-like. bbp2